MPTYLLREKWLVGSAPCKDDLFWQKYKGALALAPRLPLPVLQLLPLFVTAGMSALAASSIAMVVLVVVMVPIFTIIFVFSSR